MTVLGAVLLLGAFAMDGLRAGRGGVAERGSTDDDLDRRRRAC